MSLILCHYYSVTPPRSLLLCHYSSVTATLSIILCHYHYVTNTMSLSLCHYYSVTVTLSLILCHYHSVTITLSLSLCHYHSVTIILLPSLCHYDPILLTKIILLQYHCCKCGGVYCSKCIQRNTPLAGHYSQKPVPVCKLCLKSIKASKSTISLQKYGEQHMLAEDLTPTSPDEAD